MVANQFRADRVLILFLKTVEFQYILEGTLKYGIVGVILELSRAMISKFPILMSNPSHFITALREYMGYQLTLFLAFYVGLFRVTIIL
jgi:hypothetical protein